MQTLEIDSLGDQQRLDRWLKRRFPALPQSLIEKWARTGCLKVEGKKAKPSLRLSPGQRVEIPDFEQISSNPSAPPPKRTKLSRQQIETLNQALLYTDKDFLVLNKPAGFAVQGGTKTYGHVDAWLETLDQDTDDRPRLVHRIDKDTSGVLLIARHLKAAQFFSKRFKEHAVKKIYWAIIVGCPKVKEGQVTLPLTKRTDGKYSKMRIEEEGLVATTHYRILENIGKTVSLIELSPLTGRTHQLRVHMAALGTPILGDGKYGGAQAHIGGQRWALHLHAAKIDFEDLQGRQHHFSAPLPPHMLVALKKLGFSAQEKDLLISKDS